MPKKQSKDKADKEGLASYNAWLKENKRLEKMGLYGTDHMEKKIVELEAQVELLQDLLEKERKRKK
jgi:hypothetical protein